MYGWRDLTLGRYLYRDSPLHRLDARSKLICALWLMLAIFAVSQISVMLLALGGCLMLYRIAKVPWRVLWGNVRIFFWLFAITFGIHLFFTAGTPFLAIPAIKLSATVEGLNTGILFTVRIVILIAISNLLMAIATPQELTDGLEKLLRPLKRLKVPVSEGALMISIALRFVPILMQEAEKIRRAQLARGADLEGNVISRLRKLLPLLLPIFSSVLKRAEDLAIALEARGYQGGGGRTQLHALQMSGADFVVLTLVTVLCISFFVFEL